MEQIQRPGRGDLPITKGMGLPIRPSSLPRRHLQATEGSDGGALALTLTAPVAVVIVGSVLSPTPAVAQERAPAEAIAREVLAVDTTAPPTAEPSAGRKALNWFSFSTAKTLSALGRAVGLEAESRPLSTDEIAFLRGIFGESLDYSKIGLVEGRAVVSVAKGGGATVGNTIYFDRDVSPSVRRELLAHEATHVWQYQHRGTDYVSAIDHQGADLGAAIRAGKPWSELNREQQAMLVQLVARARVLDMSPVSAVKLEYGDLGKTNPQIQKVLDDGLISLRAGR